MPEPRGVFGMGYLQAHLTHTWHLNSCHCPAVLPCLNLLPVPEILVSFPTWSDLAGRL